MSNSEIIFKGIMFILFVVISLWGTYHLSAPIKFKKDKPECKCSK